MKCAIYTRVSTDNQAEKEFNSCEAQAEKIKSFIRSQENLEVYKIYSDFGYSGASLERPALQELFKDITEDKISCILTYKINRLTRSPKDFYNLIEFFYKYGVSFISVIENFDTSSPIGRLLRNIMLTLAQFERELTAERTKDKMQQRREKGLWNGGLVPYGYKNVDKKLEIEEKEAEGVRKIFQIFLETQSLAETRRRINQLG
ncbi:MAG: recombinase family protein [Candidatus Aminicenantales bacterium]